MIDKKQKTYQIPLIIERDEDDFYVIECPIFSGCYTQGKTFDEAIHNIKEVIALCLKEKGNKKILSDYKPKELTFQTLNYA